MVKPISFDAESFVGLLTTLIGHSEKLQNNPPQFIPQEDLVVDAVLEYLKPYLTPKGPLVAKRCTYAEGRSNLILTYDPAKSERIVSFLGSHMDVVPANPEDWNIPPFQLTREGDLVKGRGVTDCLGHVAMITEMFRIMAINKPNLNICVKAVFIASEENQEIRGIGIDEMEKQGELEVLKNGPVIWVDSANFGPTLGTAGIVQWQIDVKGKLFHSGLPHKAINCIELASAVLTYVQDRFHKDFPPGEQEEKYKFITGCSMKATQIKVPKGGLNQIPGQCTLQGDIRITPFFDPRVIMKSVESYIVECDVEKLPTNGGYGKFSLPDEGIKGSVELTWLEEPWEGIACNLKSEGHKALNDAILKVTGKASAFSLTGSLPLVGDLQKAGFDIQITGFGRMEAYHANNEYASISDFVKGSQILFEVIASLDRA